MKKREPGIDLIRCMGLLFVVSVHFFLYNGFYGVPQTGVLIWGANSFRWLFFTCNGIFMTLTGYLKSTAPWNRRYYRSLLTVLVGYLLTCLISFPIRHFLQGEKLSLYQWLLNGATFANYAWYVEMYIGLILISPIINLALERLDSPKALLAVQGSLFLLTGLPSVTQSNWFPNYWKELYPLTYYVLGAVIRRLQPKWKPWLCLAGVTILAMGLGLTSLLSTDQAFSTGFTQGYGGFWTTIMVGLLFVGLYRVKIGETPGKLLAWMAGGVFEGYILSRLLDVWIYNLLPQWHQPQWYPLLYAAITVPVFIFAILAGKATNLLAARIIKLLTPQKKSAIQRLP